MLGRATRQIVAACSLGNSKTYYMHPQLGVVFHGQDCGINGAGRPVALQKAASWRAFTASWRACGVLRDIPEWRGDFGI